jgi:hypothetical protein
MGFPIGWTDCARSVTQSFPSRPSGRSSSSPEESCPADAGTLAGKLIGNAIDTRLAEGVVAQVLAA